MIDIPDDPIIKSMERTGYPPRYDKKSPVCPVCGSECRFVYKDVYREIIGCDECLTAYEADQEEECYPGWDDE